MNPKNLVGGGSTQQSKQAGSTQHMQSERPRLATGGNIEYWFLEPSWVVRVVVHGLLPVVRRFADSSVAGPLLVTTLSLLQPSRKAHHIIKLRCPRFQTFDHPFPFAALPPGCDGHPPDMEVYAPGWDRLRGKLFSAVRMFCASLPQPLAMELLNVVTMAVPSQAQALQLAEEGLRSLFASLPPGEDVDELGRERGVLLASALATLQLPRHFVATCTEEHLPLTLYIGLLQFLRLMEPGATNTAVIAETKMTEGATGETAAAERRGSSGGDQDCSVSRSGRFSFLQHGLSGGWQQAAEFAIHTLARIDPPEDRVYDILPLWLFTLELIQDPRFDTSTPTAETYLFEFLEMLQSRCALVIGSEKPSIRRDAICLAGRCIRVYARKLLSGVQGANPPQDIVHELDQLVALREHRHFQGRLTDQTRSFFEEVESVLSPLCSYAEMRTLVLESLFGFAPHLQNMFPPRTDI
eukprot:Rmarinus@m.14774